MSASIAGQQTSEFNDLNPPDSGDKPPKARELCVVKSAELFCYTAVVVTDKTGVQSEFQLMQVSLVCSAGFNCNHSCSLCKCEICRVETRYCWSRGIGTSECFSLPEKLIKYVLSVNRLRRRTNNNLLELVLNAESLRSNILEKVSSNRLTSQKLFMINFALHNS